MDGNWPVSVERVMALQSWHDRVLGIEANTLVCLGYGGGGCSLEQFIRDGEILSVTLSGW